MSDNQMQVYEPKDITPTYLTAVELFRDGNVPESAKFQRPMPGGKMSTYIKHTWVTEQLRQAYHDMWEMEILHTELFPDRSAIALVKFTTFAVGPEGLVKTSITECGAFTGPDKMPAAYRIASAVSRGLVKCVMRRTGCGASLYDDDFEPTAKEAAMTLIRYAKTCGISKEALVARYKEEGISSEEVLDHFARAYEIIYEMKRDKDNAEVKNIFATEKPEEKAPAKEEAKPAAPAKEKKGDVLTKSQMKVLNALIKAYKIEERGFAPKVGIVNEKLAGRNYPPLVDLSDEQCQTILTNLEKATEDKPANPQHGPLANQDVLDALLSWAYDQAGMSEDTVLDVLNMKLAEEGKECLGFEFVPYDLKRCQEIVQVWLDA